MSLQRNWRFEGGSRKFRRPPSVDISKSRNGSTEQLLDPEQQQLLLDPQFNEKHVHFAEGTVSGSHLEMIPRDLNDDDERPNDTAFGGEYVKSIVYGGLDAIVTSFALVASVSGGRYPAAAVIVLGCANLIADGLSMGFGDYLSSTTEQSYAANQKEISDWEFRNNMQEQVKNLVNVYESHGMSRADAEQVVAVFSKYDNLLTTAKMTMDDGLLPPDEEESPFKHGIVTFFSFLAFGSTPILSFAVLNPVTQNIHVKFIVACVVTALALILLGIAKAKISGEKYLNSIFMVVGNGGIAALAAYFISYGLEKLSGTE
ncbi:hypothetical protein R1sor_007491 [Riccia sorocarpa]|uniref:Vacuolar iron transporter 1 n=1 Tax=Riccia sorocarpa TaxID=122646 RepID=A0ABD3HQL4_9MARC